MAEHSELERMYTQQACEYDMDKKNTEATVKQ